MIWLNNKGKADTVIIDSSIVSGWFYKEYYLNIKSKLKRK